MAENLGKHAHTNDRHPFTNFQETVKNLLRVPKQELDESKQKMKNAHKQGNEDDVPDKS